MQKHSKKDKRRGAIYGLIIGAAILVLIFGALPAVFKPVENVTHGETVAYHAHAYVDYYVNGKRTDLPKGIGIDIWPTRHLEDGGIAGFAPVHTHDYLGALHIEPRENRFYTFGDFMEIWGNDDPYTLSYCLGELCTPIEDPANEILQDGSRYRLEQ